MEPYLKEFKNGTKFWRLNDDYHNYHREDGPAIEYPDGRKYWYLNGKKVSWKEVFRQAKTAEQQVRVLIYALTTP